MNGNARFVIGMIFLIIGLLLPLGVYPVSRSDWPAAVKTAVGGVLFFGFEIMAVPAAAILGKENFDRITAKVKAWFGRVKPAGEVGPFRHAVGITLFVVPIIPTYVMAYMPRWLPDNSPLRLWVNVSADVVFLASLFVLGGDFWDKLRALFVREARAVFPQENEGGNAAAGGTLGRGEDR